MSVITKILEIHRETGIYRIALGMKNPSIWEDDMNQPKPEKVTRHLVHDAQGFSTMIIEVREAFGGERCNQLTRKRGQSISLTRVFL